MTKDEWMQVHTALLKCLCGTEVLLWQSRKHNTKQTILTIWAAVLPIRVSHITLRATSAHYMALKIHVSRVEKFSLSSDGNCLSSIYNYLSINLNCPGGSKWHLFLRMDGALMFQHISSVGIMLKQSGHLKGHSSSADLWSNPGTFLQIFRWSTRPFFSANNLLQWWHVRRPVVCFFSYSFNFDFER